jgi:hypothetical protein
MLENVSYLGIATKIYSLKILRKAYGNSITRALLKNIQQVER